MNFISENLFLFINVYLYSFFTRDYKGPSIYENTPVYI